MVCAYLTCLLSLLGSLNYNFCLIRQQRWGLTKRVSVGTADSTVGKSTVGKG